VAQREMAEDERISTCFLLTYFISYSTKLRPDGPVQRATKEGSRPNIKQKARYGESRVIRGSPQNMC
jgi:hypothetical protein